MSLLLQDSILNHSSLHGSFDFKTESLSTIFFRLSVFFLTIFGKCFEFCPFPSLQKLTVTFIKN